GGDDGDDIVFAGKLFTDLPDYGSIAISGTLTGDGIAYKNNTISISCYKDRGECYIARIEQIGHNHIGRMRDVEICSITRWHTDEVVAVVVDCVKSTIVIERKSQTAQFVREPGNLTLPYCGKPISKVYKWTVEDAPGWKEIIGKK